MRKLFVEVPAAFALACAASLATICYAAPGLRLDCSVANPGRWPGYRGTIIELAIDVDQRTVRESQTMIDAAIQPPRIVHVGNAMFGVGTLDVLTDSVIAGSLNRDGDQFTLERSSGTLTLNSNGLAHPLTWICKGG
ncbi:hypothetical protein [Acidiferrobacter sp.]|jgi:hypothetical protein|uniref:hypothetical protein n=1 Tax=Acidiferrobacter sp. TaxID=1872107 RepID=UPI002606D3E9|nr:hypothetical protein [Acidiferrobacter sp.]